MAVKRERSEDAQSRGSPSKRHHCSPDQRATPPSASLENWRQSGPATDRNFQESSSRHELTIKNLAQHTARMASKTAKSLASIRTTHTTKSEKTSGSQPQELDAFGIFVNENIDLPDDLAELVGVISEPIMEPEAQQSPRAEEIAHRVRGARLTNESSAKVLLHHEMFGPSAFNRPDPMSDAAGIDFRTDAKLETRYLPRIRPGRPLDARHNLKQPQPDTILGYIKRKSANAYRASPVFSHDEESKLEAAAVCHQVAFPYLTAQWKSRPMNGSLDQAEGQKARDGAAICNAMYWFYYGAGVREPSALDTSHFSVTYDSILLNLFVHWRRQRDDGTVEYHMKELYTEVLAKETSARKWRGSIKALTRYAMSTRLDRIRACIPYYDSAKVHATPGSPWHPEKRSLPGTRISTSLSTPPDTAVDQTPPTGEAPDDDNNDAVVNSSMKRCKLEEPLVQVIVQEGTNGAREAQEERG